MCWKSAVQAYNSDHFALKSFIDSAKGKLFVVFDESQGSLQRYAFFEAPNA